MTAPKTASCPSCGSPSIQAVPIEKKKLGEAVVAEYFLGTAAGVAAGSSMVIQCVCMSCGVQWVPGTAQERSLRLMSGQMGAGAKQIEEQRLAAEDRKRRRENTGAAWAIVLLVGFLVVFFVYANQ